jgi:hypothetical protein
MEEEDYNILMLQYNKFINNNLIKLNDISISNLLKEKLLKENEYFYKKIKIFIELKEKLEKKD